VNLKRDVSDPQGNAVKGALESLAFKGVEKVHVGKYFVIELEDMKRDQAESLVKAMCQKLLTNPVIEDYSFVIERTVVGSG
jgi:phosphoribosylformylglycinamidine synthase